MPIERTLKLGFASAVLIQLLTTGVPFHTAQLVQTLQIEVNRSQERLNVLAETLSVMQDVEIGQRGFVITGNEDFLAPYLGGILHLQLVRQTLRLELGKSAEGLELLPQLERFIDLKLEESAQTITLRRVQGIQAAESLVAGATGKAYMDHIRELVGRLTDLEGVRRTALHDELVRRTSLNAYMVLAATLLDLALLLALMYFLFRLAAQREQANRALLASMSGQVRAEAESDRLAAIVESSNDAIIGKTLEGRITSWNGAAQALFGYSAAEAIGQRVQMLIPPDREAEEMHILAEVGRGAAVPAFDTFRLTRDGRRLAVSVGISPIRDAQGRLTGASKIVRDMSKQRHAEAALRDSEARLRFTLDSAQIGDWDLDLATDVTRRSLQHDRCFGYDVPQAEWSFDIFVRHVHPDDRPEVLRKFRAAVAELKDWRFECRVVWPDASVHWISGHGSVRQENGKATRMLGIVTDITQRKLAEDARLKAEGLEAENRQIQEANRLKSQFLSTMSHELRTPLNAIIGFADLLHTGAVPTESPKNHEFLGYIGASGRHLLQLINDVLDLSKVESGKFEFFPEPVELALLVNEVTDILHPAIQQKRLGVDIDIDPTLTGLVLDPTRLRQVLYNYLSNAIKFTPEGGGHVTVRARAEGPAQFRLEVEDHGIGIAAADLPRLFIEFHQLDAGDSRHQQGTGLGLALTRRLVQAQGGSVGVRSTPGVGSVFHLVLDRVHSAGA